MIVSQEKSKINNSRSVYEIMDNIYKARPEEEQHKEHFYIIGLDGKNIIQYIDLVSIGSINYASPSTRESIRLAIVKNAVSIIAIHNHPSGQAEPSREDKEFTQSLEKACKIVEINLIDHIILCKGNYYSFADAGTL